MPQTERKKLRKNLNNKREREKQSGGRDRMRAKSECYVDSYGEKHNLSCEKLNEYNVNIKVIFFVFVIFESKVMHLYRKYILNSLLCCLGILIIRTSI